MTGNWIVLGVLLVGYAGLTLSISIEDNPAEFMTREERESLKEVARDMFYHAYNAYMDNAYPADELMPLSCKGRYRGSEPDRGDIDSTLGNFSLTLVDTLDTLVVLGDLEEFENAVRLVVEDLTFDTDVIVSLFETNIRMLGGLLSAHILAEYLQLRADIMPWYRGELLDKAKDLGYRFLPAFNTTTGIPFGRINLRYGMKGVPAEMCRETCTACAGSMILEMAALSRLTGESIFEEKAQKAMDALWKMRHRGTDLMGSVLNVHSGDWVRRDSGVGAGIDSYYEYCLKAYVLLGDEKYLGRFNKHYDAVMKYVSQGPMLLDVHMHRPNTNSKNFMDALLAFWPGLQVLKGDIKPAVETHEMLYQVMQRHNFIPEAFTTDFQVHWGHHPLRPEFLESTYFLYRATGDHYYLGVGRKVLESLQTYARVTCGYAAVSDVRTNKHDDTMDSFVLSETFKYLYLLFAEPNDLVLDLDEFIFTTEGHLLPLTLAAVRTNVTADVDRDVVQVDELDRTCPNSLHLFPASVRQPLRNMVEDVCPRRTPKRRLRASQFQANNLEHLKILSNMGITILTLSDGRVQLLHTFANARTAPDAEEGLIFMQEIVELSKKQSEQVETRPQFVKYTRNDPPQEVSLLGGPANFGPGFKNGKTVSGVLELAIPSEACSDLMEPEKLFGKIAMVTRGNCMFVEKARRIQKAGAIAGIVLDTVAGSSASTSPMFAMSGDGKEPDDITIPVVFLFTKEAAELVFHMATAGILTVTLGDFPRNEAQLKAPSDQSVYERLKGTLKDFLVRPVTSENSEITSGSVDVTASSKTIDDDNPEQTLIAEHGNLRVWTYKDANFVRIEKTGIVPAPKTIPSQNVNDFEKTWYSIKQDSVNTIYSNSKPILLISLAKVQFLYTMVHTLRGVEPIVLGKKRRSWLIMRWLLRELSEVQPDQTLIDSDIDKLQSTNSPTRDDRSTNERNIRYLDITIHDKIPDSRKREKSSDENMTPKRSNVANEDVSTTATTFDKNYSNLDELRKQDFYSNLMQFKLRLLADIGKSMGNDEKSVSSNDSTDDDEEKTIVVNHGRLKAIIDTKRSIVEFSLANVDPVDTTMPDDLKGYEKHWYNAKQYLLSVIYSQPSIPVKIPLETLWLQQLTLKTFRNRYWMPNLRESMTEKLKKGFTDYLEELSQVRADGGLIKNFLSIRANREIEPKNSDDLQSVVKRYNEEIELIATKFPDIFENSRDNAYRNVMNEFNDIVNALNNKNNYMKKNVEHVFGFDEKIIDDGVTNDSMDVNVDDRSGDNLASAEIDAKDRVEELPSKDDGTARDDGKKILSASGDPLEEFKKPIWAAEDDEQSAKSFDDLEDDEDETNELYDPTNSRSHEYSMKIRRESRNRRIGKRIDDEL